MVTARKKNDLLKLITGIICLIVINIASSFYFTRFDFTAEKRYTLSPITKNLLSKLENNIQVTVYLEGDFPGGMKRLRNSAQDLLIDFRAYSGNKLKFDFVNPLSGTEEQQQAAYQELVTKGIEPVNLGIKVDGGSTQKIIFPAALITYQGKQIPVKLFLNRLSASQEEILNNSIQNLEYAFTSAIKKITSGGKPRVGFTEGHGELTNIELNDAMGALQDGYEAGRVNLKTISVAGLDRLSLLVIPKPESAFSEAEKYKIDYFVMHGGRVLWALDQVNAELDSLRSVGSQLVFAKQLNLDDLLFKYGVRVNYDLVADMNCAQIPVNLGGSGEQGQIQLVPWLFYPVFIPVSKHPLIRNLDGVRSEFASSIDLIPVKGIKQTVLLTTSPYNRRLSTPTTISLQLIEQEPDPRTMQNKPLPVGVLSEGVFPSDFKNRPVPNGITEPVKLPEKSKPTKMIVLSDGDLFKNQVSSADGSPFPLGYDRYTQQQYGNKNLLLNIVDFLTDDSGLINLRNKEMKIRLLDKARISTEKTFWQVLNMVLPIALIVVLGFIQQYCRKRKYAY